MKTVTASNTKLSTNDMIKCGILTALIIVGSQIKFQIGVVPFTLQFAFANLAGLLLGRKLGSMSVLIYVLLGLMGVPVFSSGGGIGYIFMPTFGYLLAFIIGAYMAGLLSEKLSHKPFVNNIIASIINLIIVYSLGVLYMYFSLKLFTPDKAMSLTKAIQVGALTFIPSDFTWSVVGSLIAVRVKPHITKGA